MVSRVWLGNYLKMNFAESWLTWKSCGITLRSRLPQKSVDSSQLLIRILKVRVLIMSTCLLRNLRMLPHQPAGRKMLFREKTFMLNFILSRSFYIYFNSLHIFSLWPPDLSAAISSRFLFLVKSTILLFVERKFLRIFPPRAFSLNSRVTILVPPKVIYLI